MTTITALMAPDPVTRVRAAITRAQRLGVRVRVDGLSRRELIGMVRREVGPVTIRATGARGIYCTPGTGRPFMLFVREI